MGLILTCENSLPFPVEKQIGKGEIKGQLLRKNRNSALKINSNKNINLAIIIFMEIISKQTPLTC
jgi:hypothetical protein